MPKIKITEYDVTGQVQNNSTSNTVYIPGPASAAVGPTLCDSITKLEDMAVDNANLSYRLAKHLINAGLKVLYEGVVESGNALPAGKDFAELKDKNLYDIRFLTLGKYAGSAAHNTALGKVAKSRGDCVALLDHAKEINPASGETRVAAVRSVVEGWFTTSTDKECLPYCSTFTPWFTTTDADLYAPASGKTAEDIPGSFGYLFAYAKAVKQAHNEWEAVAGSQLGKIDELESVVYTYTASEVEILQARAKTQEVELDDATDNVGIAINPIAYVRPYGIIIWGTRTLRENNGKTKASSFLNIRNLVSTVKKALHDTAIRYTFEQNGEVLWTNFQNAVTPTLDKMVTGNGLLGYRFEKLESTDKARVKGKLIIVPIKPAEDFELELYLSDSLDIVE